MGADPKPTPVRHARLAPEARDGKVAQTDTSEPRTVSLLGRRLIGVAPDDPVEARIGAIAERQRACVSREQLLAAGVSSSAVVRRLRNGQLERVHPGVYRLPHTADLPLAVEVAALLACGADAALSHHSAATLWQLRPGAARPVHVTIPVTLTEVDGVLSRAGNHPGRARLARVAATHARSTKTDSPAEERLVVLIRAAGLPEPQVQVYVLDYRLDLFWPELKLAVEVDAYGTHGSPARFEADRRRDARLLTEKGIIVLRLTRATIEERPLEALGLLARAIGQREGERRAA